MKEWSRTEWRFYRDRLSWIAATIDGATIEWKNIMRRVKWINENRIYNR